MLEIWHNPRCSKSRRTLELIQDAGVDVRVRRYLEDAPTPAQLDAALEALAIEPSQIVRWGEVRAKELHLRDRELSRSEWLALLSENPILIERPVVLRDDGRAVIGRPPESVLELLNQKGRAHTPAGS
ncbi:MAG: arsenate reductase (glutaredoxin) [Acidobacteriota bacterium]|jgi:arsenate reductase